MNVLCVINNLIGGGAQRQLIGLAIEFKKRGNKVVFLVYEPTDHFKGFLMTNDIKYVCIESRGVFDRVLKIRKYIRANKFDAVISFLQTPNFICEVAALPFKKWKLIVGERNANPNIMKSSKSKILRFLHMFADYVVSNSHENIRMVKKLNPILPEKKIRVVYNMVDFEKWSYDDTYKYDESKFKLVIAASHLYSKNLNGVIEAVNLLSSKEKNKLRIEWYGNENIDDSLQRGLAKIESYGLTENISVFPATLDIASKMKAAHCVGLFSFYEGLPNVVCEAMSLGKPVLASAVSDVPFLIEDTFLCDPKSPKSIAKKISYMISLTSDELFEIGRRNNEKALTMFQKDKIVDTYLELMR